MPMDIYLSDRDGNARESTWIEKNNWDNFDICDEINHSEHLETNTFLDESNEYEIINIRERVGNSSHHGKKNNVTYYIKSGPYIASNLTMKINRTDIDDMENIFYLFKFCRFQLLVSGMITFDLDFVTNLFLIKLLNRSIREYDDIIEIPLILFDLNKQNETYGSKLPSVDASDKCALPIFLLHNDDVTLRIINYNKDIKMNLTYHCHKLNNNNLEKYSRTLLLHNLQKIYDSTEFWTIECQNYCTKISNTINYSHGYEIKFKHICKLLFIRFDQDDVNKNKIYDSDLCCDFIKKISLSLNKTNTISWDNEDGEILMFRFLGNYVYVISLSPEFKSKKNIKKILLGEEHGIGINFSNIGTAILNMEFYTNANSVPYDNIHISVLNVNIMCFYNGFCYTVYM